VNAKDARAKNIATVAAWVKEIITDEDKLYLVDVGTFGEGRYPFSVSRTWLANQIDIHRKVPNGNSEIVELMDIVIDTMISKGILIKDSSTKANNARRILKGWFRSLQKNEYQSVVRIKGNFVISKSLPDYVYKKVRTFHNSDAVKPVVNEISDKLNKYHKVIERLNAVNKKSVTLTNRHDKGAEATRRVRKWVSHIRRNQERLFSVKLASTHNTEFGVSVSRPWIQSALRLSSHEYIQSIEIINSIIPLVFKRGIIVEGCQSWGYEARRELLTWFNSLNEEQLEEIRIRNNKISFSYIKDRIPAVGEARDSENVKAAIKDINEKLLSLGLIENKETFISWSQRNEETDKGYHNRAADRKKEWDRLENIKIASADDLVEPSDEFPYIQIRQIFARLMRNVASQSRSHKRDAYHKFSEYLISEFGNEKFYLSQDINQYTLARYKTHLRILIIDKKISPQYGTQALSEVRRMLDAVRKIKGINIEPILEVAGFSPVRSTNRYRPFSDSERKELFRAIDLEIEERRPLLAGYVKQESGSCPWDERYHFIRGMSVDENAKWVFENVFDCEVVTTRKDSSKEAKFASLLIKLGGVHETYTRWGVISRPDKGFILPYVLKLSQLTGMNYQSISSLEIGDYVEEHPATGRPCVRYWKERSTGAKECHLDIFKARLSWLNAKQSKEVKKVFEEVKILTKNVRLKAVGDTSKLLFIYQGHNGEARDVMASGLFFGALKEFSNKYDIRDDDGERINLNFARFRPTLVSELIENGCSLREIQLMLGHSNMTTTASYLDRLDFNTKSRKKIFKAISEIHKHVFKGEPEAVSDTSDKDKIKVDVITFKTPLASCSNIFDPPDFIKSLESYVPGTPCGSYNRCLSCDNVMITKNNLPELFSMHRDYISLIENKNIMATPYGRVVEENLGLLNEILDPELSDFDEEELKEGREKSLFMATSVAAEGVVE